MEKLLQILEDIKPGVSFEGLTGLVTDEVLGSFDIIGLITEIDDEFGVDIPAEEIVPENFDSVEAIMNLIQRLSE